MGMIGQVVGNIGDLGFDGLEGANGVPIHLRARDTRLVFAQAGPDFPGQVQAGKLRMPDLQHLDAAQALDVVVEAAFVFHQRIEGLFAEMAKGAVPQVMRQRDGLREVLVGPQGPRQGAADRRHFDGDEDLRFVFQAPERAAVQDPVAVALKRGANVVLGLGVGASAAGGAPCGVVCQPVFFHPFVFASRV